MVVWEEQSRIHANGIVVAPESGNTQSDPGVARLDDSFFVVWLENFRGYGRVIFDGRTLGPITDLGAAYQPPSVAADVEGFVVVLQQTQGIDVVHLSPIGNVRRHELMNTSYITTPPAPRIACDGADCAMVWLESIAPNGCTSHACPIAAEVRAKRLGEDPIDVASVNPGTNRLAVTMKPNGDFAVAWSNGSATSFAFIEGRRVLLSNVELEGVRPALAWDGTAYVMVRNQGGDVVGTRIANEWDASDFTIAASAGSERDPDLAWPVVVYEREGMILTRDLSPQPRRRAERFR